MIEDINHLYTHFLDTDIFLIFSKLFLYHLHLLLSMVLG